MCRNAKILLIVSALFSFAMGLSGIFISVFFWKETSSFVVIVIYNLIHYITTPITFVLAGILAKKKNGIWSLRLGLLMYAVFYALILFIGNKGIIYIYCLGIIFGMAIGFYWLAFNTLSFDFTHVNNRDTFNGFNGSCSGISAAIAPITSAYIISRFSGLKGYRVVFLLTLIIFLVLFLVSGALKCKNYSNELNFKKIFSRNCDEWGIIRISTFFWAFRDVIIVFIVNILIMETTGSELSLGKFALISSLVSSAVFILVQKVIKPPYRKVSIYIGTIGTFLAIAALVVKITNNTLFIYTVLDAFAIPFFLIQLSSSTFNVINKTNEENFRIEYMINKDIVLNSGRVISSTILVFLLNSFKNSYSILKIYLIVIGLLPLISGYFLGKLKSVLEGTTMFQRRSRG
ncbi:MFS transporter [Clostridium thailandense]|uniref:MFS transporter n=1 Tax=Clostridium thailandense TaxID=2794346 RepID=A0A949TMF5_9CLOT|nr:MFS transporter [Clostridium thailandense]MBV7275574.1 MFS transporter [Clostridium thailandense]